MSSGTEEPGSRLVYFIMLALGMAMLLAYNAFIASPTYAKEFYKYASGNPNATTTMAGTWDQMETYIVITSMIPNCILQAYVVSPHGQSLSIHRRIVFSMIALTVAVLLVAILPACKPDEHTAMALLLTGVALAGASTAFFQSSTFGLASMLPERFIQAVMLGIGISGAATSLLLIIIKAIVGSSDASEADQFAQRQRQANLFFGIAAAWLGLCLIMSFLMPKIQYLKNRIPEYGGNLNYDKAHSGEGKVDDSLVAVTEENPLTGVPQSEPRGTIFVIKSIWHLMLANFLVYTVSLIVFPELCSNAFPNSSWFGIVIIFLFNFGDFCGRLVCRFRKLHMPARFLLPASVVRFIFIPLTVYCVHPKKIPGEAFPYVLLYLCGISNGYVSSLCMMNGPGCLALANNERAAAGSVMSFSLLGGCSAGSLLALLVNNYVPAPQ